MLRSASELKGYTLMAEDGELGSSRDLLFDDREWTVRYMVADTRKWLPGRKVLISPIALAPPDRTYRQFPIRLSRAQIKAAPELEEDAPVSRQFELTYHQHHGWAPYWAGPYIWGAFAQPIPPTEEPVRAGKQREGDQHLRSAAEVTGYQVVNDRESLGEIHDLIVEDRTWTIRYLVVDVGSWLRDRKVLISPEWIDSVTWSRREVAVQLSRQRLEASPPYDPASPVNRQYEEVLYDFYGRPAYWDGVATAATPG